MQFLREVLAKTNKFMDDVPIQTFPIEAGDVIVGVLPADLLALFKTIGENAHTKILGSVERRRRLAEVDAKGPSDACRAEAKKIAEEQEAERMKIDLLNLIFWSCVRIHFPETRLCPHLNVRQHEDDIVVVKSNPPAMVAPGVMGNPDGIEELLIRMRNMEIR